MCCKRHDVQGGCLQRDEERCGRYAARRRLSKVAGDEKDGVWKRRRRKKKGFDVYGAYMGLALLCYFFSLFFSISLSRIYLFSYLYVLRTTTQLTRPTYLDLSTTILAHVLTRRPEFAFPSNLERLSLLQDNKAVDNHKT